MAENTAKSPSKLAPLLLAAVFGLAFGFLLQKGGVAKYNVLVGVLLLQDFTVIKVMMSAIVTGMIGIAILHRLGKVQLHIKPTRIAANIVGGLLFGIGFALIAYCPGTGAVALGQGNWDALFGVAGLMAGSYLYAEFSHRLGQSVEKWGALGEKTLPQVLHLSRGLTVAILAITLGGGLFLLERFTIR
jgi:uncharacterized protein